MLHLDISQIRVFPLCDGPVKGQCAGVQQRSAALPIIRPTPHPTPLSHEPSTMRILHTMLRVGNLQRSIDFYTQVLGMQLLRTSENPEYKYSLAFLGFDGGNPGQAEIELTYNCGVEQYEMGTAYGHIAIGVADAYAACEKIKAAGGNVTREAGPVKGGTTVIAFVTDPDGYKIELIQAKSTTYDERRQSDAKDTDPLRSA